MVSDFVSNVSLPCVTKKKRTNRLAKLKQCKLDVRREQWLSQVKNKDCKVDSNRRAESCPFSRKRADEQNKSLHHLETKSREEEGEGVHDSDLESLINSPTQSHMGQNVSREALSGSSCSGSTSSSVSGSIGCFAESVSEEEEDGCLDSWEDVADALSADDNQHSSATNTPRNYETRIESTCDDEQCKNQEINRSNSLDGKTVCASNVNCRAWRADDAFRPQSLPSLSKQRNISFDSGWHNGHGAFTWSKQSSFSPPSCPICYEDLDVTDSSFLPCPCGFRLCLFCHKRILEADGRCPGCRKHYDTLNVNTCFNRSAAHFA